ncbi:flavodoxin [Marinitoga sp. 1135]|uniref:Putative flavoprotein n=1 Tax=Marinitoga piezophila (strain DSM 14283 / JCM 11233 / KA3) TaxID=443254 RepID=H2J662_MARPK|nr:MULTISPECIES: FprA family A-type flavoprotein [Marinitoga]AEX85123.1 putative flavoprotein [Marinitoga piezophila KA3]APT75625.1 flavodoxin [Marinitoga sp. 1137]NUU95334.1 flavodoxin [Marinitoga sp. 1135]NUU97268.1 flavodoxin [Marinitoga sp. 1138]
MDTILKITDGIYYVGVNDRDTHLFENMWPLPKGVTYNSYIIKDEKNVLIDTVKISKVNAFIEKIYDILDGGKLDYLVINHMEPDHSGAIETIMHEFPEMKIVGNKKTFEFLKALYDIEDNLYEIKDGDEIDLGKHKLKFFLTPMVHWPETMMTYEITDKIIFTGDAFGGFGSLDGGVFDDEVDIEYYENEIRRYYSNIVGKFGPMVQRAMKKVGGLDIEIVAPTHGPVWRSNPGRILELYDKWSKYETEEGVVIVYGTMYGNTEKMADYIARCLADEGIKNIRVMNSSNTHESYIINEIWRFKGVILGTNTYNNDIFPPMEKVIINLAHKGIKNRVFGVFGTYGWSGGGVKGIVEYINKNKWEMVADPVEVQFSAKEESYEKLRELAKAMAKRIKEN